MVTGPCILTVLCSSTPVICPCLLPYKVLPVLLLLLSYNKTLCGNDHLSSGSCCTGHYSPQRTFAFIKMQLLSLLTEWISLLSVLHCTVLHIPDFGEINALPTFSQDSSVKSGTFYLGNYNDHNKSHVPTLTINIL